MKNVLIIAALALLFNSDIYGQKVKPVPVVVRKAFEQKFPTIKRAIWDNSKKKYWEAEFRMNRNEYSATFDLKGKWIETEHEIDKNEIPSQAKAALSNEYVGYKIIESQISETPKAKVYKIGLKKDNDKIRVTIDANGKVLKKEPGNGMDDEDEDDGVIEDDTDK